VILSPGAVVRMFVLVLLGVVLQLAVVSQITFWGANPDVVPLMVLSVGLLGGPIGGAIAGFGAGFVVDMSLVQTLGVSSLLLTVVGYLGGRYRELRDASHTLVPVIAGAAATLAYAAAFSVTQFLLGVESPVSPLVVRDYLVAVLLNALLAIPVFGAVRAMLRPSLIEDYRPRRRSPLTGLRVTPTR
jgi:rod shape-determining protein MreD